MSEETQGGNVFKRTPCSFPGLQISSFPCSGMDGDHGESSVSGSFPPWPPGEEPEGEGLRWKSPRAADPGGLVQP